MDINYHVRYQLHPLGTLSWESYLGALALDCRSIEAAFAPDSLVASVWPQLSEWLRTEDTGVAVIAQNTSTGLIAAYRVDRQLGEYVDGAPLVGHAFILPAIDTPHSAVPQPASVPNGGTLAARLRASARERQQRTAPGHLLD